MGKTTSRTKAAKKSKSAPFQVEMREKFEEDCVKPVKFLNHSQIYVDFLSNPIDSSFHIL